MENPYALEPHTNTRWCKWDRKSINKCFFENAELITIVLREHFLIWFSFFFLLSFIFSPIFHFPFFALVSNTEWCDVVVFVCWVSRCFQHFFIIFFPSLFCGQKKKEQKLSSWIWAKGALLNRRMPVMFDCCFANYVEESWKAITQTRTSKNHFNEFQVLIRSNMRYSNGKWGVRELGGGGAALLGKHQGSWIVWLRNASTRMDIGFEMRIEISARFHHKAFIHLLLHNYERHRRAKTKHTHTCS